jgi:NitT/TauT family transport system ATP-binding protein
MKIEIKNLCKRFSGKIIFNKFNIQLNSEKINCIVGESGGGKSTLLNILAGLLDADSGDRIGIEDGDVSYIFQDDRLVDWLTVKENMELFIYDYYKKDEANSKLKEIFKLLHIEEIENKYPEKLSGGMKQRVNIARALLKPSRIILMDEPFKSLDYKTKYSIMVELKDIFKNENKMVIFVTHDVDEAIFMNGNIYVLGGNPYEIKGVFKDNLLELKEEIIKLI